MMPFKFSRTPTIHFGAGKFQELPKIIASLGKVVLVATGVRSFTNTDRWDFFTQSLARQGIRHFNLTITGEPSPDLVDQAVLRFRPEKIDVVAAIGGGSTIDAGKAISAMLLQNDPVAVYLENVGTGQIHNGAKVPFIAVPTTAGTGSEATKNAVLSRIGADGFKKSLRHDHFVPDVALIDPELMQTCPPEITAACGMDAFTQLLESFVSPAASPITDALAFSGLESIQKNLIPACTTDSQNVSVRAGMAYAALMSGITLANAGLGIVHGLASPIGGYFDIPHGVVCGTLMAPAVRITIRKLKKMSAIHPEALKKYARVGALFTGKDDQRISNGCDRLIETLAEWTEMLQLPLLSAYGIQEGDLEKIIAASENKNNPVPLDHEEIVELLMDCI